MSSKNDFDFDAMASLAKHSPIEFSRVRDELIGSAIDSSADKMSSRAFQNGIERLIMELAADKVNYCALMEFGIRKIGSSISNRLDEFDSRHD